MKVLWLCLSLIEIDDISVIISLKIYDTNTSLSFSPCTRFWYSKILRQVDN